MNRALMQGRLRGVLPHFPGAQGTFLRRIASRDAAVDDTLREIAAALIDELEHGADLPDRVQSRYRPVFPIEYPALGVGAQAALRVRPAGIERDGVERRLRDGAHRSRFALEIGIVARSAVAVPGFHRALKRRG